MRVAVWVAEAVTVVSAVLAPIGRSQGLVRAGCLAAQAGARRLPVELQAAGRPLECGVVMGER